METQKLSKAVTSASTYIEESIVAQAKNDENRVIQLNWKAASDLEYCLFLFSLINPDDTRSSYWKLNLPKQPEIEVLLTSTQDLLREAIKSLEANDLKEAHKETWLARGQLLKIHDFYEKNRGK
jgi:hypothetical protein